LYEPASTVVMSARGVSPVIGVVLLVGVTAVGAVAVGAVLTVERPDPPAVAAFDASADPDGTIRLTHRGGEVIDPAALGIRIRVDGRPLEHQPPVPFFAADGFEPGPTGAFNSATTTRWRAGETATLRVADTNAPRLRAGTTVEIRLFVDGTEVAHLETEA
jgi:hypothetical protein